MKGVKAILLASGSGERFEDPCPKQFHLLAGRALYLHTLERFIEADLFEEVLLVCHPDWIEKVKAPGATVVPGGKTRQSSSHLGLLAAGEQTEIVVIHDIVRPFVSRRILKESVEMARLHGACDTCIPLADTIVCATGGRLIDAIPKRDHYYRGQTPQSFSYPLIRKAHAQAAGSLATDDCQLVLRLGHSVYMIEGDERNWKITTPFDLLLAEKCIEAGHTATGKAPSY